MKLTSLCFRSLLPTLILLHISLFTFGQVGIGTTSPNSNALLDIDATVTPGGLLLPRVALTSTSSFSPLSAHVAGMTVYNTATINDVTPGFYYNNGLGWIQINTTANDKWTLTGNAGTSTATNYIGTSDNTGLLFKTAAANAFEISGGNATNRGKLRAHTNGTAALPVYTWNGDTDTGFYRNAANTIGLSTGGINRVLVSATSTVINEDGNDFDFRIESDSQTEMFFVDAGSNSIGIQNNSPSHRFHMTNGGLDIGSTAMAVFHNHGINGVGLSGYNTNSANGFSGVEGDTDGIGSALRGIHLPTTGAGIGVYGASNSSQSSGGWGGYISGAILVTGGYYAPSESIWKKEITDLSGHGNVLDKINRLSVKTYKWKADEFPGMNFNPDEISYGFMAQDLKEIFPDLVVSEKAIPDPSESIKAYSELNMVSGYHLVNYIGLIPILTSAIQEQQNIIESQGDKIKQLENLFVKLQMELDKLKKSKNE